MSRTHPDIDVRLFNLAQKITTEHPLYRAAFHFLHNIGLTLFINHLPSKYHPIESDAASVESLLGALYAGIDLFKAYLSSSLPIKKDS